MKIGSLFSGYGGLDLAVMNVTGAEVAWHCEWDDAPSKILEQRFPDVPNYRDVSKVDFTSIEPVDILTGGFPCQSFSLAGLRKGFLDPKDKKGQMIFYIYDIIVAKKPKYVVLENVKGIHNHNGGKTFESVVKLLTFAGYKVRVLLLNALNYGSAQNRERVIFLCSQEPFEKKDPEIIDQTKSFRDIKESGATYDWIDYEKYKDKIEQQHDFNL